MELMYACVPDIALKGDDRFAVESMGIFSTLEECVVCISELHSSFGYNIYPIDTSKIYSGLNVDYGMTRPRNKKGYKIIGKRISSLDVDTVV